MNLAKQRRSDQRAWHSLCLCWHEALAAGPLSWCAHYGSILCCLLHEWGPCHLVSKKCVIVTQREASTYPLHSYASFCLEIYFFVFCHHVGLLLTTFLSVRSAPASNSVTPRALPLPSPQVRSWWITYTLLCAFCD